MAMRRQQMQLGMDEFGDREYGGPMDDDMFSIFDPPTPAGSGQQAASDPWMPPEGWQPPQRPASLDPDLDAGLRQAFQNDPGGGGIAGNTDSYRTMGPNLAPTRGQIPIPQGATTDAASFDMSTIDVPTQPHEPTPNAMGVAMGGAPPVSSPPAIAQGGANGSTRRPAFTESATSSLFNEDAAAPALFGGGGGLNEGGYGLPGSGGPPKATEMMKALLQALKLG